MFGIRIVLRFWVFTVIRCSECLVDMNLLTLSLNLSYVASRISPIVAFIIPSEFPHYLVFTHCVLPAPTLVSVDVIVLISFVSVVMVLWPLFGIGFFNLPLLVSKIDRWFCGLEPPILLKASLDLSHPFLLITPFMILRMI